jgi:predicted transcriptional regulator
MLNPEHSHDVGGGMRRRRVDEILQPYEEGVPLDPCVEMGGRIIDAIQLMVTNNLKCLTVTINKRPVGMVRLDDAFKKVGLLVRSQ